MALTLTLDLADLTFGQLATFVDAARRAGVEGTAQLIVDTEDISLVLPAEQATATAPLPAEAAEEHAPRPAASTATSPSRPGGVDPVRIADALKTMAAAEPAISKFFDGLSRGGFPPPEPR